jgi:4-hydroxy-tetrahydrodipicolinate synthase
VTGFQKWSGVFPAVTTQFSEDGSVNLDATQSVIAALVADGVHGVVVLGTVGENNVLEPDEKRDVIAAAVEAVGRRVPVITGVSELSSRRAQSFARDARALNVDGLRALPALVYVPTPEELAAHFETIARATDLPIMLYNNPPAYRVSIGAPVLERLRPFDTIVAIKESSPDPRRISDLLNQFSDRFNIFAGLDDVALESLLLGANGWVSGLTNAFPKESLALYAAAHRRDLDVALEIYRWFMPLLHLDADHDLVQSIKLAEEIMGRGSERVRMPRLPLAGMRRTDVIERVQRAAATRPQLSQIAA